MLINYETIVNKLGRELDTKVAKSELIASNIANIDTPGYKAKSLKFERVLSDEMGGLQLKKTHPKHMEGGAAGLKTNEVVESTSPGRPDGNNVNVDQEMLKLSKNNIQYNVAVQLLSKRLKHIKEAITAK
ncbi:MAG: flagellar basal body rod protein FlgB [bacterium]|nr:flagellar basal body rod protein FlgB [bacterium]